MHFNLRPLRRRSSRSRSSGARRARRRARSLRDGGVHCARRHLACALAGRSALVRLSGSSHCAHTHRSMASGTRIAQEPVSTVHAEDEWSVAISVVSETGDSCSTATVWPLAARPLFYGEDYRPESRPSSSYAAAEQLEIERRQAIPAPSTGDASPSASMLPPRSTRTGKPKASKEGGVKESSNGSSTHIKLVHAPAIPYETPKPVNANAHEGEGEGGTSEKETFDPESSLALPSSAELMASFHEISECLARLAPCDPARDPTAFNAQVDRLCRMTERFIDLSTFLQSGALQLSAPGDPDATVSSARLCARLFHQLCTAVLDRWSALPTVVLELTPSLVQLFASTRATGDSAAAGLMVQLGKLLFMLSKDSANDRAFCSIRFVEAALSTISSTSVEASARYGDSDPDAAIVLDASALLFPVKTLIYVAGTLKNLSSGAEERVLRLLATHGCIPILSETLRWRPAAAADTHVVVRDAASKDIAQLLVQTTGVLRNLSASKSHSKQFLEARVTPRLCAVVPDFVPHQELMVNVSRILSKLTLHERPRAQINEAPANVGHLVALADPARNAWLSFADHPAQQQAGEAKSQEMLLVRLFFVLGNLCASNDRNREAVVLQYKGAGVLLRALQFYGRRYVASGDGEDGASEQTVEILVKLVRALANVAINANVATELDARQELAVLPALLRRAIDAGDEELMLNAVSFVTNLSFFHRDQSPRQQPADGRAETDGFMAHHRLDVAAVLARILLDPNEEAVLEAARTFGNLSRHSDVLDFMRERKVLDCCVLLLDHSSRDVVLAVCGVLMNAALGREARRALRKASAPASSPNHSRSASLPVEVFSILTGILADSVAADDVEMALVAGKTLSNLLLRDGREEKERLAVATVAMLRRVVESVMETLEHSSENPRTKSNSCDDGDEGGDSDDASEDASSGDAVARREFVAMLPLLLQSINSS